MPTLYLDTTIVSGLARKDLAAVELTALHAILQAEAAGEIELCTSPLTKREISNVPPKHRSPHDPWTR